MAGASVAGGGRDCGVGGVVVEIEGQKGERDMEVWEWLVMIYVGGVFCVATFAVVGKAGRDLLTHALTAGMIVILVGQAKVAGTQTQVMERQASESRMQWRLAAWEKRYAVYELTMGLMEESSREWFPGRSWVDGWKNGAARRGMLFGSEVRDVMGEIEEKCERQEELYWKIVEPRSREETERRKEYEEELASLQKWFEEERQRVGTMFQEYLKVEEK